MVIVVEGDFARDVVELREKGPQATNAKAALLPILTAVIASQEPGSSSSEEVAEVLFDGFIACLRFESGVTNLQELTFNRFIRSADLSPNEAQNAISRLLAAIKAESLLKLATLVTPEILKDWLGLPERSILQRKPVPDPYDVDRKDLLTEVAGRLEKANALVLDGVPKIGKSHLISRLIDESKMDHSYFWFTFAGGDADKDRFVFQLAHWVGQRSSVWGTKDDIQRGHLQPIQAIERLAKTPVGAVRLVLDDCHKANDQAFLAAMLRLLAEGWPEAKIIFISEERLARVRLSGVPEMTVKGLELKEGLDLLRKLHIDVRGAIVELGLLCVQADGHPVLLRAIAKELSERPSPAEVTQLSTGLLSALSVQPFLQVLSERLIKSLKTDSHRVWLTRLASVTFPFSRALALEVAHLEPPINVSIVDWNYLTSQILDASGAEQYTVPPLLRPLLTSEGQEPNSKLILVTAARHVFRNARASSHIDFGDFQGAILALVIAERYEEAAMRFSFSLLALLNLGSFSLLELLFTVLNGDFVQAKLVDPFARFLLLLSEIQLRIQNEPQADYSRILDLLRRIRVLPKAELTPKGFVNIRTTVHAVISMVQVRRLKDAGTFSVRQGRRAFAPLQTALRMAVPANDQGFLQLVLGLYDKLYTLEKQPDLELLKRAILTASLESKEISDDALVGIYAQFVISKKYDDSSLTLCEQHSREYRAAQRGGPFFACEHAIATILHDRFSQYNEAREKVSAACTAALALGASHDVLGRTELLLADSYWAENQYANSAKHYERCLPIAFQDEALNQWVRERLADCLILLNEFHQATQHLVTTVLVQDIWLTFKMGRQEAAHARGGS